MCDMLRPDARLTRHDVDKRHDLTFINMRHKRRSERLGVTERHGLLVLALLLHVQIPGIYFASSYKYRKLNNFRLKRYTI